MPEKSLDEIFEPLFNAYNDKLSKNLSVLYPLDPDTDCTFDEANFTSNFIKGMETSEVSGELGTWDEFSVPKGTKILDPESVGRIDSLIIDQTNKRIFLLEAKRLRQLNQKHPDETVADTSAHPESLIADLARAFVVANSDILPNRIWKPNQPLVPLGSDYQDYEVYGLGLCGIWTRDRLYNENDVKAAFIKGGNNLLQQNPKLNVINLSDGTIYVNEIKGQFPKDISSIWQFFSLLYVWKIQRSKNNLLTFNIREVIKGLTQIGIAADEMNDYWYLYPANNSTFKSNSNKFWIYKNSDKIELFAYSSDKRNTILPDNFVPTKKGYVAITVSRSDPVSQLKKIFDEIIELNP